METSLKTFGFAFIPHVIDGSAAKLDLVPDYLGFSAQIAVLAAVSGIFESIIPLAIVGTLFGLGHLMYYNSMKKV